MAGRWHSLVVGVALLCGACAPPAAPPTARPSAADDVAEARPVLSQNQVARRSTPNARRPVPRRLPASPAPAAEPPAVGD